MTPEQRQQLQAQLAPTGMLRVALNMSNFLLVNATDNSGKPDGVSPAMARAIAEELQVRYELVCFEGPGLVADAATQNLWDIANIAAEAERAKLITFSPAYCEIQATYLLPPDSSHRSIQDVDSAGTRIGVKARSAYDLWLTENLQHATLVRAESLEASFDVFAEQQLEALAGLRPKLIEQQQLMPGSTLLDESFTAVQQSIGCLPGNPEAAQYLADFVDRARQNGLVRSLIEQYGVSGKLNPSGLTTKS